jgi:hypothetical protein
VKILKRIISIVIWTVIALNLLIAAVLRLPAVQQSAGSKVSAVLSETLGTSVSIGRVDLGFLDRIIIDDVTILDQRNQPMLIVTRLSAKIAIWPLTQGRISISSAQLFGAHARLWQQNAQSKPNFQFIIDSLAPKDTLSHTPLDLRINSLIIRRSSVTFDRKDVAKTSGQFNPQHLHISDLSAHINLWALTDDSLSMNVKKLSLREASGLDINRLSFRLTAAKTHAILENFKLQMPSSNLQIDTLIANYQLNEKGLLPGSLTYSGEIKNTIITPSDLRCFIPSLKNFQRGISITTKFNGTDQKATIPELHVATSEEDIDINVNGWIENWRTQPAWHLEMNQVTLAETSIDFLSKLIPNLPPELTRIGNLHLTGAFSRNDQGYTMLKSLIRSGAGDVDISMAMDAQKQFSGNVQAKDIRLGQILADNQLGTLSTQLQLKGQWPSEQKPTVNIDGIVSQFDFKGYSYHEISINGEYKQGTIAGTFNINDPNLMLHLKGEATEDLLSATSSKVRRAQIQGVLSHFSPSATHLSEQFGSSVLSAELDADFAAHNVHDAQGNIRISNLSLTASEQHEPYQLDNLIVISGYDEGVHFISLKSDFADAEVKGHFDYETLPQSFINLVASKLPTLPGLPAPKSTDNNFNLRLLLSKTDWLKRFFNVDLTLNQPISLTARVNDKTEDIYLDGDLPSFAYNGAWYSNGSIHISSPADTLNCDVNIQKLMDDGQLMGINLKAHAADNNINTSLSWDDNNPLQRQSGNLNTIIRLYKNLSDQPEAHFRVQPSHIILNNSTWDIEPSDILYHKNHLLVDHFAVHRGTQHIIIDGIASENPADSLIVDLNEVEVAYILNLVNFHSVEFSGKATGRATAHSLFNNFTAHANLRVGQFKFENGRMGTLYADVDWNRDKEQIDISAVADDGPEAQTLINGYVSPVHNTIDLDIRAKGTYIDFMHDFTKSFISHITGHAEGDARIAGTLDNINLTGNLVVDGEATITPLNTTYQLKRDTVVMIPDEIELHNMVVTDREGHQGILSGGIHHKHLTSLSYDLHVSATNLLAYDITDFDESSYYGTVYVSGDVDIRGHGNEVVIDCDVTPQKNSEFVYNVATPDALSSQEFIEWIDDSSSTSSSNISSHTPNSSKAGPKRATDTDIYINFLINTTPDATLRLLMDANTKDYITLTGEGVVRATYHNKGAFNMFGTYTVEQGTYGITIQNIIKKNFTFNRGGTIVFGGDPYQAALNLQAVYTVNGVSLSDLNIGNSFSSNTIRVNCLMNIGGQPAAPLVDFDLEMPTVNADEQQMIRSVINGQQEMNQQVVYLLAIGRFYNQGTNNANDQQTDRTSLAMQSFLSGTLSTQINTLLGQIIKNNNWNFGANISTGNEGWHNAEYEGIINGRMLNNRLHFNGQFGYRDNATKANPSFIGDFDLQYMLYPNGNLALKVYNQTNDRYFTRSSLNTQGLGIIMKKDFNGLRDLFTSSRRRGKASRAKQAPDQKP